MLNAGLKLNKYQPGKEFKINNEDHRVAWCGRVGDDSGKHSTFCVGCRKYIDFENSQIKIRGWTSLLNVRSEHRTSSHGY